MWGLGQGKPTTEVAPPVLDLSGPRLRAGFEGLTTAAETQGGVERFVGAIALKASLFEEVLADGKVRDMDAEAFDGLCVFMPSVRRRVAPTLKQMGFAAMRDALAALFDGWSDTATTDARVTAFCARFPDDRGHRWVRDLAAEALHYAAPTRYPLMQRWVWDLRTNSGVLREIWYGDDMDHHKIDRDDDFATFAMLRDELSQFLADNGVYRDVHFYIDLLCAHIYADYVSAQGSGLLRADFSTPDDPLQYTRRMLGLDGVDTETGRTRLKLLN